MVSNTTKQQYLSSYWSDWPHPKIVMYQHIPGNHVLGLILGVTWLVLVSLYSFLFCCNGVLLFPIVQIENAIARLVLVRLTPSKDCYVSAYTGRPCFRAHLWGGTIRFGASVLLFVLLWLSFVVPHHPTWKDNCSSSTGRIDPIQSLLSISIHWATML